MDYDHGEIERGLTRIRWSVKTDRGTPSVTPGMWQARQSREAFTGQIVFGGGKGVRNLFPDRKHDIRRMVLVGNPFPETADSSKSVDLANERTSESTIREFHFPLPPGVSARQNSTHQAHDDGRRFRNHVEFGGCRNRPVTVNKRRRDQVSTVLVLVEVEWNSKKIESEVGRFLSSVCRFSGQGQRALLGSFGKM